MADNQKIAIKDAFVVSRNQSANVISTLGEGDHGYLNRLEAKVKKDPNYDLGEEMKDDYTMRVPTIEEFVTDDYWLGSTLRPSEDSEGLFPTWKDILVQDFGQGSRIHNVVLTGSLGIGKTYIMVTMLLYKLAITTLLKNPQAFLGLGAGSAIIYNTLSITKAAVTETAFGEAMNFMGRSPYFREECNFDPDNLYTNGRIHLGKRIYLTAGSKGWHLLGRNVLGVALDEGNWRNEANPDQKAYELYNEVRTRIANRFLRTAGFLPAISIIASSAKDESSFTETVIKEIEQANDPLTQKVYRSAVYKIKRHKLKLTDRWFRVGHGVKNMEPVVLSGWYDEKGNQTEAEHHEEVPKGMSVELVPEVYLKEFQRHTRTALQSIAGISTGGSNRLFSHMMDVERCIEQATASGVVNPCRHGVDMIPISSEDNLNVWDYLDHKLFLNKVMGQIRPRRHPDSPRFGHIDLATQNMAGISICHLVGNQLVEGLIKDGQAFSEYRLIVEYDFILTITAGRTKPINLEKLQRFFFWLVERGGYRFGMVTADQFQSEMPLQMMEARGFKVDKQSLDRDKSGYYSWRTGFEEIRIRPYRQHQMMREIEMLLDGEKKVDHPKDGSKDTTDAAAGAYVNAINSDEKFSVVTDNAPSVYTGGAVDASMVDKPPIDFNLPMGYTKTVHFDM